VVAKSVYITLLNHKEQFAFHRRSQGGQRGHYPSQICRKYNYFVLWEAFF